MLSKNHSLLAVSAALILPLSWLLPVGVVSHLIMDKFIGRVDDPKVSLQIDILTHLILLLIGVSASSLAISIYAIVCFNTPDLFKYLSKRINLHDIYKFNRLQLTVEGQQLITLFEWILLLTIILIIL